MHVASPTLILSGVILNTAGMFPNPFIQQTNKQTKREPFFEGRKKTFFLKFTRMAVVKEADNHKYILDEKWLKNFCKLQLVQ